MSLRPDPALRGFVAALVPGLLGQRAVVDRVSVLQARPHGAVLLVRTRGAGRFVLKVAGAGDPWPPCRYERVARLARLARAAGAPVPEVVAADDAYQDGPWRYLLVEHVEGVEWRQVRPGLTPRQTVGAYRQLADALLAVQSVRLASFGELDDHRPATAPDLLAALHRWTDRRIRSGSRRALAHHLLDQRAALFAGSASATLCHDDLHDRNVVFRHGPDGWTLVGLVDWDKAWAGPAESDVARMAFWDGMTGPGFEETYRAAVPAAPGQGERALVYQMLWCLEHEDDSPRHAADTAHLARRLGLA